MFKYTKIIAGISIISLICIFYSIYTAKTKPKFYILTYSEYIPKKIYQEFEKQTGIQVIECKINTDGNAEVSLLLADSEIDLVLLNSYNAQAIAKLNKLDIIDCCHSKIIDPQNYFVPFVVGYYRIAYNTKILKCLNYIPDNPLDLIFDLETVKKLYAHNIKITITDCCFDILYLFAAYKGYDINNLSSLQKYLLWNYLFALRPYINKIKALTTASDIKYGLTDVALDISIFLHTDLNPDFCYHDLDSLLYWADGFCIPKNAKNKKYAQEFLKFLNTEEVQIIIQESISGTIKINPAFMVHDTDLANNIQIHKNWKYFKISGHCYIFDNSSQCSPQIFLKFWNTLQIAWMITAYCRNIIDTISFI